MKDWRPIDWALAYAYAAAAFILYADIFIWRIT